VRMTSFGRYRLVRKLAQGGMAEVFLAEVDDEGGIARSCVVKRIHPYYSSDANFVAMFLSEGRLAIQLSHPNIVDVFEVDSVGDDSFIAMEFIDGVNLRQLAGHLSGGAVPAPFALAARIVAMAAGGLHYAHGLTDDQGRLLNLVHRDMSADNVLASRTGQVKVLDFGIAKVNNRPNTTRAGILKGKIAYMSPEHLNMSAIDRRADIYALGLVLFELVCGRLPFDTTSAEGVLGLVRGPEPLPRASLFRPDLPPALDDIIARCLRKERDERYGTCRELCSALANFIDDTGASVGPSEIAALVEACLASRAPTHPTQYTELAAMALSGTGGHATDEHRPIMPETLGAGSGSLLPQVSTVPEFPPRALAAQVAQTAPDAHLADEAADLSSALGADSTFRGELRWMTFTLALIAGAAVTARLVLPNRIEEAPTPIRSTLSEASLASQEAPAPNRPTMDSAPPSPSALPPGRIHLPRTPASPLPSPQRSALPGPRLEPSPASPRSEARSPVTNEPSRSRAGPRAAPSDESAEAGSASKTGRVDFRVRPYADVFVDGRRLGSTPLPLEVLSVGRHEIRLVNSELNRDVKVEFQVHPGENMFKFHFEAR
jgi:serine/threonine-protein kinase